MRAPMNRGCFEAANPAALAPLARIFTHEIGEVNEPKWWWCSLPVILSKRLLRSEEPALSRMAKGSPGEPRDVLLSLP
jgi:hypothetical protein